MHRTAAAAHQHRPHFSDDDDIADQSLEEFAALEARLKQELGSSYSGSVSALFHPAAAADTNDALSTAARNAARHAHLYDQHRNEQKFAEPTSDEDNQLRYSGESVHSNGEGADADDYQSPTVLSKLRQQYEQMLNSNTHDSSAITDDDTDPKNLSTIYEDLETESNAEELELLRGSQHFSHIPKQQQHPASRTPSTQSSLRGSVDVDNHYEDDAEEENDDVSQQQSQPAPAYNVVPSSILTKYFSAAPQNGPPAAAQQMQPPAVKAVAPQPQQTIAASVNNSKANQPATNGSAAAANTSVPDSVLSQMKTLQSEIEKYQRESSRLKKVRQEEEHELQRAEIQSIRQRLENDRQRFEEYKSEEGKKLKQQRVEVDAQRRKLSNAPQRAERSKIDELTAQIQQLQDDFRTREERLRSQAERLKKQVELLTLDNSQLKEELQSYGRDSYSARTDAKSQRAKAGAAAGTASNRSRPTSSASATHDPAHTSPQQSQRRPTSGVSVVSAASNSRPNTQRSALATTQPAAAWDSVDGATATPPRKSHATTQASPGRPHIQVSTASAQPTTKIPQPSIRASAPPNPTSTLLQTISHAGGKLEHHYSDGLRLIQFPNGTKKYMYVDGRVKVHFTNGDTKESTSNGQVIYYYSAVDTTHTTDANGDQVYQFTSGQVEYHYANGEKLIYYTDNTKKKIYLDGREEVTYGTIEA